MKLAEKIGSSLRSLTNYIEKYMASYYLNTFRPLCITKYGREAMAKYDLQPFIDGSCRREPDFESVYPSISALCRGRNFAPRLEEGDKVIYFTVKKKYDPDLTPHYKYIALLEVFKKFENHLLAANWYIKEGLSVPSNCLVPDNDPFPVEKTIGALTDKKIRRFDKYPDQIREQALSKYLLEWDQEYLEKVKTYSIFLVCQKIYIELNEPKPIYPDELIKACGRIPGTRTPGNLSTNEFQGLIKMLKSKDTF